MTSDLYTMFLWRLGHRIQFSSWITPQWLWRIMRGIGGVLVRIATTFHTEATR